MTPRYTVTTEKFGYDLGSEFTGVASVVDLENAMISRVVVGYNDFIYGLTVDYVGSAKSTVTHGGQGVNTAEVILEPGEWITRIEGQHTPHVVTCLRFESNMGRTWGPFGVTGNNSFVLEAVNMNQPHLASHMGLLYFSGQCNNYIRELQATFAEYPTAGTRVGAPPGMLKFEKQAVVQPTAQTTGIHATFSRHLMSRVITLHVGPDKSELHAHESILCSLPFFRAALQGHFKEASVAAITMPEDDPETIGALIEFLYTGNYSYAFEAQETTDTDQEADIPPGDVTQGSFHVGVYSVASKYDCEALVNGSLKNFTYVMKQLAGIDVIELWKAAYVKDLYLTQFEGDVDLTAFMQALPKLVRDMYRDHREEMEAVVVEYPVLGSDLLRIVTADV